MYHWSTTETTFLMLVILIGMQWYVNVALFCITMMTDDIKYLLMCWFALHISYFIVKVKSKSEVAQSCPTLCDPMDCSLPGSSVHGIFQAGTQVWVTISFSRGSSQPRDRTQVSCLVGRHFTIWATREAPSSSLNGFPVYLQQRWLLGISPSF